MALSQEVKELVKATMGGDQIRTAEVVDALEAGQASAGSIKADGSIPFTGNQSLGSHKLTNVTDPSSAQDAATKNYVDTHSSSIPNSTVVATNSASYFEKIRCYAAIAVNVGTDITYIPAITSGEDDSFHAITTGLYSMTISDVAPGAGVYYGFSLNSKGSGDPNGSGADLRNQDIGALALGTSALAYVTTAVANQPVSVSVIRRLAAGDVIRNQGTGNGPVSGGNAIFSITKII